MIHRVPSVDAVVEINAAITGMPVGAVQRSVKVGLLDSALHAPLAGFGDTDLYPGDYQRLGILCSRIVLNHPFIDGNKRTGALAMLEMAYLNERDVALDDREQEAADRIEALAAGGLDEDSFCDWLRPII